MVAEGSPQRTGSRDQRMVGRNEPLIARGNQQIDIREHIALTDDQPAARSFEEDRQRVVTEVRGKDSVCRNRRATTEDMPQCRGPDIRPCACTNDFGDMVPDAAEPNGIWACGIESSNRLLSACSSCTLRHDHDRESRSTLHAAADELFDRILMEGDLGDQDHVRSAGDARGERDPSRIAPHHLADHHAVMTVRCRMQPIDRFGRRIDCREEPEGDLRAIQVVIDRLWDADDIDASLHERRRTLHRTIAADDDERIDSVLANVVDACCGDIAEDRFTVWVKPSAPARGIAAVVGAEDGSAARQDAGNIAETQWADAIFDQPLKSVLNAKDLDAVLEDGRLGDRTDDRIQPWAVAATSQDADAADGVWAHGRFVAGKGSECGFRKRGTLVQHRSRCERAYSLAMHVATQISRMKESATLAVGAKVTALKANGVDVVGFAMGEPDFDTPQSIKQRAADALMAGMTKYAPTPGDKASREAIAAKLRSENGIDCAAEHVTITVGAKHAIFMALQALIEPGRGDEFILPTPAWVSYRPLIELAGGVCVEVAGSVENAFRITPQQLDEAITPRTVGLLLNSPSNPCGVTYPANELRSLIDVVANHPRISIVSDEIYEKLIFPEIEPGLTHWSPASDPRVAGRTVTVNGMSKAFAMTGWRLGYLCAPGDQGRFIREIIKLQGQMTNSVPSFFLPAVVEALSARVAPEVERMRAAFAARAGLLHRLLSRVPGLQVPRSTGAFYAFPSIAAWIGSQTPLGTRIDSAQSFADALLAEAHVAVVPGEDFGTCARHHVRLSFACSEAQLTEGVLRLDRFVRSLQGAHATSHAN